MKKTKCLLIAVSALALSGCATQYELAQQQKKNDQKITELESKVDAIKSESQGTDEEMAKAISQLQSEQSQLVLQTNSVNKSYAIKENDTLYSIAQVNNMPLDELLALNPQIDDPRELLIGQIINIK
ncbi:hypothetical protein BCU68_03515 [Vibrio sp. 10N.286.49.B3]|uniref:LysM peptidoglycan-binding domain-containing protein n=1 Tax=Vibrio sp. 10N.286.49.B3 TaxID=1880855 RepID=UPI000C8392D4|nr:LysM domain-containing protein [Vibrio sp. 10N.286.49.B3]PMH44579.1 hypothetical protein BCU68_03515 [Vibrio sp. 10N.286.49.B3]